MFISLSKISGQTEVAEKMYAEVIKLLQQKIGEETQKTGPAAAEGMKLGLLIFLSPEIQDQKWRKLHSIQQFKKYIVKKLKHIISGLMLEHSVSDEFTEKIRDAYQPALGELSSKYYYEFKNSKDDDAFLYPNEQKFLKMLRFIEQFKSDFEQTVLSQAHIIENDLQNLVLQINSSLAPEYLFKTDNLQSQKALKLKIKKFENDADQFLKTSYYYADKMVKSSSSKHSSLQSKTRSLFAQCINYEEIFERLTKIASEVSFSTMSLTMLAQKDFFTRNLQPQEIQECNDKFYVFYAFKLDLQLRFYYNSGYKLQKSIQMLRALLKTYNNLGRISFDLSRDKNCHPLLKLFTIQRKLNQIFQHGEPWNLNGINLAEVSPSIEFENNQTELSVFIQFLGFLMLNHSEFLLILEMVLYEFEGAGSAKRTAKQFSVAEATSSDHLNEQARANEIASEIQQKTLQGSKQNINFQLQDQNVLTNQLQLAEDMQMKDSSEADDKQKQAEFEIQKNKPGKN